MSPIPRNVDETADYIAITRLLHRYADVVTRRAWPELAELFLPGCPIILDLRTDTEEHYVGPEEFGVFIATALSRFDFFEFAILNSVVDTAGVDDDIATGRVYICELRRDAGTGAFSQAFGLYQDEYARDGGRWWFARRRYSSLARHDGALIAFPIPPR
jgi:hypothetical protein